MSESESVDFEVEFEKDLNTVKEWDGSFTLVPPGTYRFNIVGVERQPGKVAAMAKLTLIVEAAYDAEGAEIENDANIGAKVFQNYSFSEKALGRVKQLMLACGANLDKWRASEINGATIIADVVHNLGQAKIGDDGVPMEPRTFANIQNERAYEAPKAAKATAKAATPPPPAANKPANGAARRA